jgi:succinate dehydrogenase/fumarate reductase flavoprotein subunit
VRANSPRRFFVCAKATCGQTIATVNKSGQKILDAVPVAGRIRKDAAVDFVGAQ